MEYDKKNYRKTNDKKILHKVRKHWVVISTALLMAIGGGAAATSVSAHADTSNNNDTNNDSTNTVKEHLNANLQMPQNNNGRQMPAVNANNGTNGSNTPSIKQRANNLYQGIMNHAVQQNHATNPQQSANDQSAPKVNNQSNVGSANANASANNNGDQSQQPIRRSLGAMPQTNLTNVKQDSPSGFLDADGLYQQDGNYKWDSTNQSVYSDYSDQNDPSDNGSDYGEITVQYVDPSDHNKQLGATTYDGPDLDGTPFGTSTDPKHNNVNTYSSNIPQGGPNPYGYSLDSNNPVDSGSEIHTYVGGEDQHLIINVHRNQAPASPGKIMIQYEDTTNGYEVISSRVNSDSYNKPFDYKDYTKVVPQGYEYQGYQTGLAGQKPNQANSNPINNYGNGNLQMLTVFVAPISKETNATVNYRDKNNNDVIVNSRTISGIQSSDIDYKSLNTYVPSGYKYVSDVAGNPSQFAKNGTTVNVNVAKDPNSANNAKPINYGTVTVHYQDESKKGTDITNITFNGPDNSDFSWDNANQVVPDGYKYFSDNKNNVSKYEKNTPQNAYVYVNTDSSYRRHPVASDYIQYIAVDPNNSNVKPVPIGNRLALHGYPGTPIDYTPYTQFLPQGYKFVKLGNVNPKMESNQTNTILVESSNSLAQPLDIHYINQNGSDVDNESAQLSDNQLNNLQDVPENYKYSGKRYSDNIPLSGKYNDAYTAQQIASLRKVPSGYSLDPSENNLTYHISSDEQRVNLLVNGKETNSSNSSNPSDANARVLDVRQHLEDPSGHDIKTVSDLVPVMGTVGQKFTLDPSNYMPTPSSNFTTTKSDKSQSYQLSNTGFTLPSSDDPHFIRVNPNHKNEIIAKYNYKEMNATANVFYEDPSDGNNVVGSTTVTGTPNTPMTNFYNGTDKNGLNDFIPYGFKYVNDAKPTAKLTNGSDYVINVANAHLQNKPTVTPRQGYGYITVNYGSNLSDASKSTVYSTVTVTGKDGSSFNSSDYMKLTNQGNGKMPDVYSNPQTTNSDKPDMTFSDQPGTYDIDVSKNSNAAKPQMVSDMINYEVLKSDGTIDTGDTNVPSSFMIKGLDGTNINYVPYTNNVPTGYYYDGTATYSSIYDQGQDKPSNPIATIYLKKAAEGSNAYPNYYPSDENNNSKKGNQPISDGVDPNTGKPDGDNNAGYYPGSDAPTTGTNPNDDLPFDYTPSDPNDRAAGGTTDNTHSKHPGYVPNGYVPGWVPNKKTGKYQPGYVPSDRIPSGYVPGEVPNGKGGYVPGYVPGDSKDWPTGKNGQYNIPKYVPGQVPNGKPVIDSKGHQETKTITVPGKNGQPTPKTVVIQHTVPGIVPNVPPYATGSASQITVQYVNAYDHSDVISNAQSGGNVGANFDLNKNNQYMINLPAGYTDPVALNKSDYTYSDSPQTAQVALKQIATGNVIYEDADKNNTQVGTAYIHGAAGDKVDFSGNDNGYTQLLPYNFNNPSVATNNPSTLTNGADYVIYVHEAHQRPAASPQPQKGYGKITVNYVSTKDGSVVGTDSFIGENNSPLSYMDDIDLGKTTTNSGYIPYGYTNANQNDINAVGNTKFDDNNGDNVFTIHVDPDPSTSNKPTPTYSDKIQYEVVTKHGDVPVMYTQDGKGLALQGASNASTNPLTFTVSGKAGTDIDYAPYQTNVPAGYQYDGMGDHSSVITNGGTETVLLRPAKPAAQLGTINVDYKIKKSNGQYSDYDTLSLQGFSGSPFNLGYYEDDLPVGDYQFSSVSGDNPTVYTNQTQNVTIYADPQPASKPQYSNINVYFVKADDPKVQNASESTSDSTLEDSNIQVPGSIPETMTDHIGDPFSIAEYEYNTPYGTEFDHVVKGTDIGAFGEQDQNIFIAVKATNGQF